MASDKVDKLWKKCLNEITKISTSESYNLVTILQHADGRDWGKWAQGCL